MARTPRYLFGRAGAAALASLTGGGGGGGGGGSVGVSSIAATVAGPVELVTWDPNIGWGFPPVLDEQEFTIETATAAVVGAHGIVNYDGTGGYPSLLAGVTLDDDTNQSPLGQSEAWQPRAIDGRDPQDYYWTDPRSAADKPFPVIVLLPGDYTLRLHAGKADDAPASVAARELAAWIVEIGPVG